MRNVKMALTGIAFTTLFFLSPKATAQVDVSVGADLMSRYVWRGTDFGGSPSIQPYLEMSAGSFVLGAWGAYTTNLPGAQEADLYAGYSFSEVFGLTLTDYYFPLDDMSDEYFDFENNHSLEISGTLTLKKFSLLAGKFFAGADDKSLYLEAGYDFGVANIFLGAGDEVYTTDGDFGIVNVGIGASKEIKLTDYFSLPLSGAIILNPESESLFLVVGVSF
ncbi:TorF family putative porin [Thermophagus sp. OGC60D27]|uniref:TorF family putative porin n=1 Tax=Thermophagus sp. OGC60D27 TaxID=3458415 RepID=UPI0040380FD6